MRVDGVVDRLRSQVATFSNRVFGLDTFAGEDLDKLEGVTRPAAYVYLTGDVAVTETDELGATVPTLDERCAVILSIGNTTDDVGSAGANALETLTASVRAALVGWAPSVSHLPLRYAAGRLVAATRQEILWELEFVARRPGGTFLEYELTVSLAVNAGTGATVVDAAAAKIATTTGGTRFADDHLVGREAVASGATRFRLRSVYGSEITGRGEAGDANVPFYHLVVLRLKVVKHLAAGTAERTATEGDALPEIKALLAFDHWSTLDDVYEVLSTELDFPGDVTRRD